MSITILSSPGVTLSADNALFIVNSTEIAQPNFRFVADVVKTTNLARLKCDKLPDNNGFFNVARVVETLVPMVKPSVNFFQDPKIASTYDMEFREEYGNPPTVTGGGTLGSGIVFQGYKRQWEDFVSSGYYTSGSTAKILSKQPSDRKIRLGENDFVSVLFRILNVVPSGQVVITNNLRSFSVTSGLVVSDPLDGMWNTGLAGIFSLTSGQTSDSKVGSYQMGGWNNQKQYDFYNARATADGAVSESNPCAFDAFDSLVDFYSDGNYTVSVKYLKPSVTDYYSEGRTTEAYTIAYEFESCERFAPQRLFFKNSLGGFDGYTFTMKNRKTGNMTKQTFGKNQNIYGTKVAETIYSGEFEETMTLNSDWLIDANWMSELIYSPQVYLQIGSELVEAIVNTSSFAFHTRPQDKLQQLQVEVKIAYKNNVI